jgi:hypothetical protein
MKEHADSPPWYTPQNWKPRNHARYYLILGNGEIQRLQWNNTPFDYEAWDFGNCFRLRREAEQAREKVKDTLINFHKNHDKTN